MSFSSLSPRLALSLPKVTAPLDLSLLSLSLPLWLSLLSLSLRLVLSLPMERYYLFMNIRVTLCSITTRYNITTSFFLAHHVHFFSTWCITVDNVVMRHSIDMRCFWRLDVKLYIHETDNYMDLKLCPVCLRDNIIVWVQFCDNHKNKEKLDWDVGDACR